MNFKEFWNILQGELKKKKEFMTLKQRKKFKAHFEYNTHGELIVRVTTKYGEPRGQIPSNEFEGVWNNAKGRSRETRFVNEKRRLEPYQTKKGGIGKSMNVSYITKLIDHIVKDHNMK
jgi:hypothetical protein